jgi:hypothetical protein
MLATLSQGSTEMRKIKLELESLSVESFETAGAAADRGTVMANEATQGGPQCGSAYDACQTGLCTFDCDPTYSPDACPTHYPQYC